jgi:hypothetical protein
MRRYIQPKLTPVKTSLHGIPKGYLGTRKTLEHIQVLVHQGAKDFFVRQKAIDILLEKRVSPKNYLGEINALFEWVQRNVRYTKDPFRVEVLHTARRLLELRAGDCDDMAILLAAMLESIGHPTRLVITGPDPRRPRLFSHIYLEVHHRGDWIPLDATMPFPMGWSPRAMVKEIIPIKRDAGASRQKLSIQNPVNHRRNLKMSAQFGLGATPLETQSMDWLQSLVRSISAEAITPRDPRVKRLYDLLRARRLLAQSPWLKARLVRIWQRGLAARQRPRLTRRLMRLLRRWGLLPAGAVPIPAAGLTPLPLVTAPVGLGPYRRRMHHRRRWLRRHPAGAGLRPVRVMAVRRLRPLGVRPPGVRQVSGRRFYGRRFRGMAGSQP